MSKFKGLAKLLGLTDDAAKTAAKDPSAILKAIDTPEKAAQLTGDARAAYLRALDETYGPRAKRSADMGFGDKTWYHGSASDIKEFDPAFLGRNTNSEDAKKAFFFADNPKTAASYAEMAGANEITELTPKIQALRKNLGSATDPKYPQRLAELQQLEKQQKKLVTGDIEMDGYLPTVHPGRGNVMPVQLKLDQAHNVDLQGRMWSEDLFKKHLDDASKASKDSAILRNTGDSAASFAENPVPMIEDIAAVRDPSKIRSKFAAFDPRFAKSGSLVAGAVAMPNDLKPSDSMTMAKLKAYLENPSVALENLKRAGKMTEGDEIDAARKAITAFNPEANPSDDEIMQQVRDNQMVRDSAEGFVGGGVAKVADSIAGTSKMNRLKQVLEGKTTRESLNKPGAAIPEEFGSRADIIRRANEVAKSSTSEAVDAARNNMLQRIQDMKSLSPEDATAVPDILKKIQANNKELRANNDIIASEMEKLKKLPKLQKELSGKK